ncbi:hypothetical protein HY409_02905 [Candidatus Gottesmanbacteria bacterium]|nr:hypothetical protein [Candidatus Gottesmanbacteria bacterium]
MKKITRMKKKEKQYHISLPSDESIARISGILLNQQRERQHQTKYAPVKEVLSILGKGVMLSAVILAPKSASFFLSLVKTSPDYDQWKHYNISYLRRTLRRLEQQKTVEITKEGNTDIVRLTQKGRQKILKYSIDTLTIDTPKRWDGKWRLVLYDVPRKVDYARDLIRDALRAMGFYSIQESVYIYPYPCKDQITFLREYYALGRYVQYMLVDTIEDDEVYKTYFDIT